MAIKSLCMSEPLHQQKYKSSLLKRRLKQLAIATGATKSRDVMFTIPLLPILYSTSCTRFPCVAPRNVYKHINTICSAHFTSLTLQCTVNIPVYCFIEFTTLYVLSCSSSLCITPSEIGNYFTKMAT